MVLVEHGRPVGQAKLWRMAPVPGIIDGWASAAVESLLCFCREPVDGLEAGPSRAAAASPRSVTKLDGSARRPAWAWPVASERLPSPLLRRPRHW